MALSDTLNTVLMNVTANRAQVFAAHSQSTKIVADLDPEVLAAARALIAKLVHPQAISQTITAVVQAEQLDKTLTEMDALLASVQTTLSDEKSLEAVAAQVTANSQAADSPLPVAGQASQPAPAVAVAPAAPAAAPIAAEAVSSGAA